MVKGLYDRECNLARAKMCSDVMVHELTHAVMNMIFDFESKPYFKPTGWRFEYTHYSEDNNKAYNLYFQSSKDFLKNLVLRVSHNMEEIDEFDYRDTLYGRFQSFSILNLFLVVIGKRDLEDPEIYSKIQSNYFADQLDKKITQDEVKAKFLEEVEKIGLNSAEIRSLERLVMLFANELYEYKAFDSELIAFTVQLTYLYGDDPAVQKLFAPLYEFWHEKVHPLVMDNYVIPHQQACSGEVSSHNFAHCVVEYLDF